MTDHTFDIEVPLSSTYEKQRHLRPKKTPRHRAALPPSRRLDQDGALQECSSVGWPVGGMGVGVVVGRSARHQEVRNLAVASAIHSEKVRGPLPERPDPLAVHFTFEVTLHRTGQRVTIEEVGVYTVKDDQITRAQFFYDGEHERRRSCARRSSRCDKTGTEPQRRTEKSVL